MAKRKREFEIGDDGELIADAEIGNPDDSYSGYDFMARAAIGFFIVIGVFMVGVAVLVALQDDVPISGEVYATTLADSDKRVSEELGTLTGGNVPSHCAVTFLHSHGSIVYRQNRGEDSELSLIDFNRYLMCNLTENFDATELQPDWAADKVQIAFVSDRDGNQDLWIMDTNTLNSIKLTYDDAANASPDWSPDSTQLVFASARNQYQDIHIINANGGNHQRITDFDAYNNNPVWSPDGSQIAFTSDRDGQINLFLMNADGSNVRRLSDNGIIGRPAWSPDGTQIIYAALNASYSQSDLWVVKLINGTVRQLTHTSEGEYNPLWREDRILYLTDMGIYEMSVEGWNPHLIETMLYIIEFDYVE